ncbi:MULTISPECIES: superoxide dismutase [unclassified Clostridium]|uniref:superoxide dismutase n=1 Tax=unclassified Clostridium TaxID=2614128 RepID=UPI00189A21BC|nr:MULTISPECIES: superoxide dismutase [unclassified Clostridium]MCR1952755.1 superoxide dismutase [Clostridium sp. DSM 100503]
MKTKNKYSLLLLVTLSIISFITLIPASLVKSNNLGDAQFELKPLPYAYDALEPYIDKETMMLHHDKHEKAYVDNLNKAISKYPELYSKGLEGLLEDLESVPDDIREAVKNNAGGVYNHEFFWSIMSPTKNQNPKGDLLNAINRDFESYDNFKTKFKEAALGRFGSGWAWLVSDKDGKLSILSTANQDSPISSCLTPIIGIDVWEHAYYLKYQNRRAEYIDNWWNVVNWEQAEKNYTNNK